MKLQKEMSTPRARACVWVGGYICLRGLEIKTHSFVPSNDTFIVTVVQT